MRFSIGIELESTENQLSMGSRFLSDYVPMIDPFYPPLLALVPPWVAVAAWPGERKWVSLKDQVFGVEEFEHQITVSSERTEAQICSRDWHTNTLNLSSWPARATWNELEG